MYTECINEENFSIEIYKQFFHMFAEIKKRKSSSLK